MPENRLGDSELHFPIECYYKIIAEDHPGMQSLIELVLKELNITSNVVIGHHSAHEKYVTFNITVLVHSKKFMNQLDARLRAIPGVKVVL